MGEEENLRRNSLRSSVRPSVVAILDLPESNECRSVSRKATENARSSHLEKAKGSTDDADGYRSSAELTPAQKHSDGNHSFTTVPMWERRTSGVGNGSSDLHTDACDNSNALVGFPTAEGGGGPGSGRHIDKIRSIVESTSSSNVQRELSRTNDTIGKRRVSGSTQCSACSDNDENNAPTETPVWRWMDDVHWPSLDGERESCSVTQSPVTARRPAHAEQSADNHPLPRDGSMSRSSYNDAHSGFTPSDEAETEHCSCRISGNSTVTSRVLGRVPGEGGRCVNLLQRRRRVANGFSTARATGLFGTGGGSQTSVSPAEGFTATLGGGHSSIGGHHLAFQHNGVFMKESCSRREESFYEMLKPVQEYVERYAVFFAALYASEEAAYCRDKVGDVDDKVVVEGNATTEEDTKAPLTPGVCEDEFVAECDVSGDDGDPDSSNTLVGPPRDWKAGEHGASGTYGVAGDCAEDIGEGNGEEAVGGEGGFPISHDMSSSTEGHLFSRDVKNWEFLVRLAPFVPRYHGLYHVRVNPTGDVDSVRAEPVESAQECALTSSAPRETTENRSGEGEKIVGVGLRQMIVLEDICSGFQHPCVLDLKMGKRQYGLNPPEAKLRSKEHKAAQTTTKLYGVRLAGMRRWCPDKQRYETRSKLAGRLLSLDGLRDTIYRFMQRSSRIQQVFKRQIMRLRRAFFQDHVYRFFTSSLLFVYDADDPLTSARVVMVDFAFTYEREELLRGGDADAEQDKDVGYIEALKTVLDMLT
ncbi:inositol polyphosphate kinase-like protein [Trypanosoma brucei equiperdum]|uniref:Kinase n=1 Tax=Trypanosoma brucei equiperdum TaxID=630700 RepID=A0A3L6L5M3_9TRYP|nr:inositol polyphosphate kinase-like protein [Trypanosoma brucei equiperdum]